MFKAMLAPRFAASGIQILDRDHAGAVPEASIVVHDPRFYRRTVLASTLGLADAYANRDFETPDLETLLTLLAAHARNAREKAFAEDRLPPMQHPLAWWLQVLCRSTDQQSPRRSKRVGRNHYDLSVSMYERMLGPSMAYSCGYWNEDARNLDEAQFNKYELLCRKLGLKRGMRILEIGCGWGGFAAYAIKKYDVTVVGVSISKRQIAYIQSRHAELCEAGALDVRFMDYRDIPRDFPEAFDAAVSIGMFEHVGPRHYDAYMRVAWRALKPGGKFLLHTIVGNGGIDPFVWYRVFIGGVLPMEWQVARVAKRYFVLENLENFGYDYYLTLNAWRENYKKAYQQLNESPDERESRFWEFYLTFCAVLFKVRLLQLNQYVFSRGGETYGYQWNRPKFAS